MQRGRRAASPSSGSALDDLARDEVEAARAGLQGDLALVPHERGSPLEPHRRTDGGQAAARRACRPARRGTARPRPRAARAGGAPLASEPSARTIAVPGHARVVAGREHRAREARRARGDVAVGAHEARRHVADAGEDEGLRSIGVLAPMPRGLGRARCAHGTYSIVARDPATGELGVAVQSHWFSVGSLVIWARPGRRRGGDPVGRRARLRPARARAAAAGERRRRGARRRARRRSRWRRVRQVGVVDARRPRRRPHRRRTASPSAGHARRRRMQLPGEHDGPRRRCPARWRPRSSAPRATLAERLLPRCEGAEAEGGDVRGRQSAALLVVPRRRRAVAAPRRPARRGPRGPARRARRLLAPAARLRAGRARPTSCSARATPRRGRAALRARGRARAGVRRAAVLGRAVDRPHRRPRTPAPRSSARAAGSNPAGSSCWTGSVRSSRRRARPCAAR